MKHTRTLTACVGIGLNAAAFATGAEVTKPNIVFFLADDLGYMDVGANNPKTFYETPSIDRMARQGMRFTQGYAACPVCSPTRASIMSGKHPVRLGITDWIRRGSGVHLSLEEVTIAEALRDGGYTNFFSGKWHLGEGAYAPHAHGFSSSLQGGGEAYYPARSAAVSPRSGDSKNSDRIADEAVRFIEKNKDRPFFAYLPFLAVHVPIEARPDLRAKYEKKLTGGPPERWSGQTNCAYAAMLEQMDSAIGRVLEALDRTGVAGRTIVVFTSDNGGLSRMATSNLPLRGGKGSVYEGGIREPWIICAPGLTKPGSICNTPVLSTDFYPTLLELAGLPPMPAQHVDGISLLPLLRGGEINRGPLFWHYPHSNNGAHPAGAVRLGDWKLVESLQNGRLELFNLSEDMEERNDLSSARTDVVKTLQAKLEAWRREVKAQMPDGKRR